MFNKLKNLWNNNGFEILLVCSLILIALLALFKIGKKGTWSTSWYQFNKEVSDLPNKEYNSHGQRTLINNYYNTGITSEGLRPSEGGGEKNVSKGEAECRRVLQQIFKKPFNTARPNFLRNPVQVIILILN